MKPESSVLSMNNESMTISAKEYPCRKHSTQHNSAHLLVLWAVVCMLYPFGESKYMAEQCQRVEFVCTGADTSNPLQVANTGPHGQ